MIEVRLFATFREGRNKIEFMESDGLSKVADVLCRLNIPEDEVAICLVNGFHSTAQTSIKKGDVLALFPPVGGG